MVTRHTVSISTGRHLLGVQIVTAEVKTYAQLLITQQRIELTRKHKTKLHI
jgi:hypothetical protein